MLLLSLSWYSFKRIVAIPDKHTVSIYVDQDLLEKLNEFKTNGEFKSLNVALNSFLRESFLDEVSGKGQGSSGFEG